MNRTSLIIILTGCVLCLVAAIAYWPRAALPPASSQTAAVVKPSGLPMRLRIPAISVDAPLEHVGLTATEAMDAPRVPADAAWYDLGPRPGAIGDAVIDGHYGWKDSIPAVFDHLSELRSGDMIYVTDDMGSTTAFVVRSSRIYGANDDAASVFIPTDGMVHLNLITCGGAWNGVAKSYSDRLVVFADKA